MRSHTAGRVGRILSGLVPFAVVLAVAGTAPGQIGGGLSKPRGSKRDAPPPPPAPGAATARIEELREMRSRSLGADRRRASLADAFSSLSVDLLVEGDAARGSFAVTRVDLTEAVDDTGGDLRPRDLLGDALGRVMDDAAARLGPAQAEELRRRRQAAADKLREVRASVDRTEEDGSVEVSMNLGASARGSKTIRRLSGTLHLLVADGERRTVKLDKPASRAAAAAKEAAAVDDPALKDAGLVVKLLTLSEEEADAADKAGEHFASVADGKLVLHIEGDPANLGEVRILDGRGETVGKALSNPEKLKAFGGRLLILLDGPLDDEMTVEIDLHQGLRRLTVPFDFKDVPLP